MIRKTHSNTPRMASFSVPSGSSGDSDAIVQQFTKIVTRMIGSNHLDSTIRIALRLGSRQMGKPGKHPSTPAYTLPLGPRTSEPLNPGRRSASRLGMRALSSASASSNELRFLTILVGPALQQLRVGRSPIPWDSGGEVKSSQVKSSQVWGTSSSLDSFKIKPIRVTINRAPPPPLADAATSTSSWRRTAPPRDRLCTMSWSPSARA